jgi:hypothetical protein
VPLDQGRARATTRSARPRPEWVLPVEVRVQARPVRQDLAHQPVPARPVSRLAAQVVPAVLVALAARGRRVSVRLVAGRPVVLVTQAGQAVRVLVVRARARAACRHGPSPGVAVPVDQAVLVVAAASALGQVAVAGAQVRVVAVPVVAGVAQARRVPVPVQPGQVPAGAAGAVRKVPSVVRAGVRRAAGSRRSSVVKSSTTCRRRLSAACRYRAATGR